LCRYLRLLRISAPRPQRRARGGCVAAPRRSDGANVENGFAAARPYARVRSEDGRVILNAIAAAQGNKTLAARRLGLSPRQLQYRLAKLGSGAATAMQDANAAEK
jgi:transcriptional regulator with GAF, ATPase, and Fis domain